MKRKSLILLLPSLALFLPFVSKSEDKKPALNDLHWLAGCWDNGDTLYRYEEQWMQPAGSSMLGMSRTISKGRTAAYEFLRIQKQENGDIYFVANPSGQLQDSFKLVEFENHKLTFENPQHDFPQRVIYRLNVDSLIPRIEGTSKGKQKSSDFPMIRTKCD